MVPGNRSGAGRFFRKASPFRRWQSATRRLEEEVHPIAIQRAAEATSILPCPEVMAHDTWLLENRPDMIPNGLRESGVDCLTRLREMADSQ